MTEADRQRLNIEARMSEEDRQAVNVLSYLSEAYSVTKRDEYVRIYTSADAVREKRPDITITPEEMFRAVDYYYTNRMGGYQTRMVVGGGLVDVYSPHIPEDPDNRVVLLKIRNVMVPEILENAYLLARGEIKKK